MLTLKVGKLGGNRALQLIFFLGVSVTRKQIQTFQLQVLQVLQGVLVTLKEIDEGRSLNTPNAKPQIREVRPPSPGPVFLFIELHTSEMFLAPRHSWNLRPR